MKLINPGGIDTSIYGNDGVVSANRIVDVSGNTLSFINSDIDIDANLAVPSISDADEDTKISLEQTADEDRIRFQSASTFFVENEVYHGHFDEDGFEFRMFTEAAEQAQLDANDEPSIASSVTRRSEVKQFLGIVDDSIPTNGMVPGILPGETASHSMFRVGRDTRMAGIGAFKMDVANGQTETLGILGENYSTQAFLGWQTASSIWIRSRRLSDAAEYYHRLDSTRWQVVTGPTGSGGSGQQIGRDPVNYNSGGGAHWMNPVVAVRLLAGVGVNASSPYHLQTFDATLRGMSWVPTAGTLGQSATGNLGNPHPIQMNLSANPVPTPCSPDVTADVAGITTCTAFDAYGNGGPTGIGGGIFQARIEMNISFQVLAPTGESVYRIEWWENSHDVALAENAVEISFNIGNTRQTVSMSNYWPGKFIGLGVGPLGYSQIELRIQRISGADDIQVIQEGSHVMFMRQH